MKNIWGPRYINHLVACFLLMSGILKFVNKEQVQKKDEKFQCAYVILYHKLYNYNKGKGAMH